MSSMKVVAMATTLRKKKILEMAFVQKGGKHIRFFNQPIRKVLSNFKKNGEGRMCNQRVPGLPWCLFWEGGSTLTFYLGLMFLQNK